MKLSKSKSIEEINEIISSITEKWTPEKDLAIRYKTIGVNAGQSLKGKKLSKEHCLKMSQSRTGVKRPKEFIERLRILNSGKKLSEETKIKLSLINKGKKLSEETKKKIVAIHLGAKRSPEARNNLSLGQKTSKHVSINGVIYRCLNEASRQLGIPNSSLSRWVLSSDMKWKEYFYVNDKTERKQNEQTTKE